MNVIPTYSVSFSKQQGENNARELVDPFSATRRYKRHQNKAKVKGLGRNSPYFSFFLWFYEKDQSIG